VERCAARFTVAVRGGDAPTVRPSATTGDQYLTRWTEFVQALGEARAHTQKLHGQAPP
jgi:hypothetical protein